MTTIEASQNTQENAPQHDQQRLTTIVDDVVDALREVITTHRVTYDEYRAATDWLTTAGQQDFQIPLLLDVFLSTTVDEVESSDVGTESNVEGPFYIPDAPMLTAPYVLPMRDEEPGEMFVFSGTVTTPSGSPLAGALVDIWQDNGIGEYSHFHPDVPEHNLRGRLLTDDDGRFELRTVLPVAYEIPTDGAVGGLLAALGRSAFRPAHLHFKVSHPSARPLTTQIYFRGDPWLEDDVVVGAVKDSLVTPVVWDDEHDERRATASYDFVLASADQRTSNTTATSGTRSTPMPTTSGIHHISLTVTDIDRSVAWYSDVLGLGKLMDETHPDGSGEAVVLGTPDWSMCVGLHVHTTNDGETFAEQRTGLDHVSFLVPSRAELDDWKGRLTDLDVEHSPVTDCDGYSVLVFRDPDNIQLELVSLG